MKRKKSDRITDSDIRRFCDAFGECMAWLEPRIAELSDALNRLGYDSSISQDAISIVGHGRFKNKMFRGANAIARATKWAKSQRVGPSSLWAKGAV